MDIPNSELTLYATDLDNEAEVKFMIGRLHESYGKENIECFARRATTSFVEVPLE